MNYRSPDLTLHAPRSPRVRLGGYAHLPRLLDKWRAVIAGKNGAYDYNCALDQQFLQFTGLEAETLKAEVAKGGSDTELLAWVTTHAPHRHAEWEIAQWSDRLNDFAPSDNDTRAFFNERVAEAKGAHRKDIKGWFDYLDMDDFVTFGGNP